jgi:hypothetical protein
MWDKIGKDLFSLFWFETEVLFIGLRRPPPPELDFKFRRGVGKGD